MNEQNATELKGVIADLTKKVLQILNTEDLQELIQEEVRKEYNRGVGEAEIKLDMNFLRDTGRAKLIEEMTFENIKGLDAETAEKLRKELQMGLVNLESTTQLAERIKKVMDVTIDRAKAIARTETTRATNAGILDGARESGIVELKEWFAAEDERTCPTCGYMHGQVVSLDAKFTDQDGNVYDQPPAHPLCRCTLTLRQK